MSWIRNFLSGLRRPDQPQIIVSTAPPNPLMVDRPVTDSFDRPTADEWGAPRCESRKVVGKRSWRCVRDTGHAPGPDDDGHAASDRSGRHW